MFQPADSISLGAFSLMAAVLYFLCVFQMKKAGVEAFWTLGFVGITVLASVLAMFGVTAAYPIPVAPMIFGSMLLFGLAFSLSKNGSKLADHVPLYWLIGFQGFRLPLELILHHWADIGTIPVTMTWTGSNIDILAGVVALLFIPIVKAKPRSAWIPQVIGFVLILNVLRVVVMSSPFPFAWDVEPPLLLAMYFPYVLIGPLFVLPAFVGHLLVFKKLKLLNGIK